jgi:hypothetical protein
MTQPLKIHQFTYTGWWYTYPSEKCEFVSWDDFPFPTVSGKSYHPVMFQSPPTRYMFNFFVEPNKSSLAVAGTRGLDLAIS